MTRIYDAGGFSLGLYDAGDDILVFTPAVDYYINLLILQYQAKPKARAFVGSVVKAIIADGIYQAVGDAFDLDTAVGVQLDVLASYVGVSRIVHGLDLTHSYFSYAFTTDTDPDVALLPGYAFTEDAVVDDYFLTIPDAEAPVYAMNDDELRRVIKFVAQTNSNNISMKFVDDLCFQFFQDKVDMTDNGDMTMTYTHDLGDPDNLFSIIAQLGFLPHPAGVKVILA